MRRVSLLLYPIRFADREHVPARGPFIVVANHTCWKDPPAIELALNIAVRFMGNIETFDLFVVVVLS